ncbi:MAG: ATP-binding protein, partial [Gammaproteobacteria bacterium]
IYSNTASNLRGNFKQYQLNVADQLWQLYYYSDPVLEHSRTHWTMWWFLISGLLFTSLLGLGLLLLTGRYFRTEQIVQERTTDLLQAKDAAETANKTKDQFLAKISHELRTPLNGIMGFTQLLHKNSNLSGPERHQIEIISHCSDDLLNLINDILDISAIENNKIKIAIEKFDCQAFFNDIVELYKLKSKEKRLDFVTTIDCLPRYLNGDKKRIRQILSNLLNNAIKYTDHGQIALSVHYQNDLLKFTVTDTGCGISSDHLNLIFSPFIQINNHGVAKEGIGIGLAICNELIKLMRGKITVHSKPGIGSEFTVLLPLPCNETEMPVNTDNKNSDRLQDNNNVNILIADDNEINLLLLTNLLDKQHYFIDSTLNGKEALDLINRNQYHLAFVDLNMPVMDGIELVKRLRKENNALTMIAISAYADRKMIQEALDAGFDNYLTKPIDPNQLIRLLVKYTEIA